MLLAEMHETIEKLKSRIESHSTKLAKSESLTRYALVDPLLRVLGWDPGEPDLVATEYQTGSGYADYALFSAGKPLIIIEAKKLGHDLKAATDQSIAYCIKEGIRYFAVTDGNSWRIFDSLAAGPLEDKSVARFEIKKDATAQACLLALALWRPANDSGQVRPAEEPIEGFQVAPLEELSEPSSQPAVEVGLWCPLAEFEPEEGEPPPFSVRFPDESTRSLEPRYWNMLQVAVLDWLVENDLLRTENCPIPGSRMRFLVSTESVHPSGKVFKAPRQIGDLYTEVDYSRWAIVSNCKTVIKAVGQDPARFVCNRSRREG